MTALSSFLNVVEGTDSASDKFLMAYCAVPFIEIEAPVPVFKNVAAEETAPFQIPIWLRDVIVIAADRLTKVPFRMFTIPLFTSAGAIGFITIEPPVSFVNVPFILLTIARLALSTERFPVLLVVPLSSLINPSLSNPLSVLLALMAMSA